MTNKLTNSVDEHTVFGVVDLQTPLHAGDVLFNEQVKKIIFFFHGCFLCSYSFAFQIQHPLLLLIQVD